MTRGDALPYVSFAVDDALSPRDGVPFCTLHGKPPYDPCTLDTFARNVVRHANSHATLVEALQATLPALIRLGDFVGNVDEGGASNQGRIDRCALILEVRAALEAATERA